MKKRTQAFVLLNMFLILIVIIGNYGCNSNSSTSSYPTTPQGGGGTPGANEVWLQGIAFVPATKTITAGTTITFINKDNITHIIASGVPGTPDGAFNSGDLTYGNTYSYKFNTKGTIKYYCQIHGAMMTATMIVQ
jgi:plastocyanin